MYEEKRKCPPIITAYRNHIRRSPARKNIRYFLPAIIFRHRVPYSVNIIAIRISFHNVKRENTFFDSRSEVVFFYSDDDGVTWHMSEGKCSMPNMANCLSGLQEPGVLELNPWVLWGFARTDLGRQYEMYSIRHSSVFRAS